MSEKRYADYMAQLEREQQARDKADDIFWSKYWIIPALVLAVMFGAMSESWTFFLLEIVGLFGIYGYSLLVSNGFIK